MPKGDYEDYLHIIPSFVEYGSSGHQKAMTGYTIVPVKACIWEEDFERGSGSYTKKEIKGRHHLNNDGAWLVKPEGLVEAINKASERILKERGELEIRLKRIMTEYKEATGVPLNVS